MSGRLPSPPLFQTQVSKTHLSPYYIGGLEQSKMETLNTAGPVGFSRTRWSSRHSVTTDFKIDSPTMKIVHAKADVPVNILLMLQRIDTKIESQKQRLGILETTSPTSSHDTTLFETSPLLHRQNMKKTINTETVTAECDELKD
jgi:hypothetical protein